MHLCRSVFSLAKLDDQGWFLGSWLVSSVTLMLIPPDMLDPGEQHIVPGQVTSQKGLSASPEAVPCTTQVDTSLCGSVMGSDASSAGTAERPLLTPATPTKFFLLLWGKMGPLSGKKTQALITQRGTGVGGAPHHHPHLLQTCARQSPPHWEQSHSGKAGTVTQTLQIQTQLHMPSLSLTLGHTAGLAVPRPHSSSCFL